MAAHELSSLPLGSLGKNRFCRRKTAILTAFISPQGNPFRPGSAGPPPRRGRQAPSGRGMSWLRHDWGSFLLHSSLPFRGAKGDDNHRWRPAVNRSPLSLRTVLGAPRWGAGPEPADETGLGAIGPPCAAKNRAAAGHGSPALHFRLEIRTPKILPPPGRR